MKIIKSHCILEILFVLNKYKLIDFMLNVMFDFTFNVTCLKKYILYPYHILVGIKKMVLRVLKYL